MFEVMMIGITIIGVVAYFIIDRLPTPNKH